MNPNVYAGLNGILTYEDASVQSKLCKVLSRGHLIATNAAFDEVILIKRRIESLVRTLRQGTKLSQNCYEETIWNSGRSKQELSGTIVLMRKLDIGIGVIGILVLIGVAISRYSQQAPLTDEDLLAIATRDDPKTPGIAPELLRTNFNNASEFVIYLPECSGCTSGDPVPDPLPDSLKDAIFVKRTSEDMPTFVGTHRLQIDSGGSIQRGLNAFKLPRIYRFNKKNLVSYQRLNESIAGFLQREEL